MAISTDYLVIGAGAMGMAFADTLLAETDAHITIVDRSAKPGGHWNVVYPFVRLHQPSRYYGVASRELEQTPPTASGWAELATGAQITDYLQAVLDEVFLPSGRVTFLGESEVRGDEVVSLTSGQAQRVTVRRKTVQAGLLGGTVPATHTPSFAVEDGAHFVPINALSDLSNPAPHYVVLGSGKTGIDACLQLLDHGIGPDRIIWVMPRDSWFLDRRFAQPAAQYHELKVRMARDENRALIEAKDAVDLFDRLEATGNLLRLDTDIRPTSYKCATVTHEELDRLRQIKDIVRLGHVSAVTGSAITLTQGEIALAPGTCVVDCTASGIPDEPEPPVFRPDAIVPNGVRPCQPTFCAALIAHLEATIEDDAQKNALCQVAPMPRDPADWLRMGFINRQNQYAWLQVPELRSWMKSCRLDMLTNAEKPDVLSSEVAKMQDEIRETMIPSTLRMPELIKQANTAI